MQTYTLLVLDTSGIQPYIFGANNLTQNVGASYLVDCVTGEWVTDTLNKLNLSHNILKIDDELQPFDNNKKIESTTGLEIEVIYAGGGNILMLFASEAAATQFSRCHTRRVLKEAPGLQVNVVRTTFNWGNDALGGKTGTLEKLMTALGKRNTDPVVSSPQPGLGVTAACAFTGLPAIALDKDERLISSAANAKYIAAEKAHNRLKAKFEFGDYVVPRDFEHLGGTAGESSFIAVVHADGNGMGKRIMKIRDNYPNAGDGNRAYIQALRAFSLSIRNASHKAMNETIRCLKESIGHNVLTSDGGMTLGISGKVKLSIEKDKFFFPMRPIVYGGDDVTFICDGRLGLSLAHHYLETFCKCSLSDGEPAHCRAGVAVVNTHFPFARAYQLAEDLCKSAKNFIKEKKAKFTALDWHFAVNGLMKDLDTIRQEDYMNHQLLLRPVCLEGALADDVQSWDVFVKGVLGFLQDEEWADSKNKVLTLREKLRQGPNSVQQFLEVNKLTLPDIGVSGADNGFKNGRCAYLDAIEAIDFFVEVK